ncbi:hypothetical protein WG909_12200 [Peptostreptococcaceae bacterium AGR-M142]
MKLYKKFMLLGMSMSMVFAATACTNNEAQVQNEEVKEETNNNNEDAKENSNEEGELLQVYEVVENPDLLKDLTGFDADFKTYLDQETISTLLLDTNQSIVNMIDIYPGKEDPTSLYIYSTTKGITDAKLDSYNGSIDLSKFEYTYEIKNNNASIDSQMKEVDFEYDLLKDVDNSQKKLKEKFEGKKLNALNEYLNTYSPVQVFTKKDCDIKIEVYPIVSDIGYTASMALYLVVDKDENIKELYVDGIYKPSKEPLKILDSQK